MATTNPPPYQVPIFNPAGSINPQWLSWFNLVSEGLTGGNGDGTVDASQVVQIITDTLPDGSLDFSTPPILTGVNITNGFNMIFIGWDPPQGKNHGYVEVYRSASEIFSYAIPVGTAIVNVFGDTPPDSRTSTTWYYWVRAVSKAGVAGPFNAVLGLPGHTADDPLYMLELLEDQLSEDQLTGTLNTRINLIDVGTNALTARMTTAEADLATAMSLLSDLTNFDEFDSGVSYAVNDVFKYSGSVYKVISPTSAPSPTPPNITYYELIGQYSSLSDLVTATATAVSDIETWIDTPVTGGEARLTAHASNISSLQTTISDPDTGLVAAHSAITEINNVASSSTSASAAALYSVSSKVNNPTTGLDTKASVTELTTVDSTLVSAVAQTIFQTTTELNGKTTTVEVLSGSVDGLEGQYTVKVDSNGYVAGYGLAITGTDEPSVKFAIVADKFSIAPVASNPLASDGSPFFHLTVPTEVNGVTLPAGTYLKKAMVGEATIDTAQIRELSADKITAGTITAAISMVSPTITGGTITGATVRTNSSVVTTNLQGGAGVIMTEAGNCMIVKDESGRIRVKIGKLN